MSTLKILPCFDGAERAAHCHRALQIPREQAAQLGRSAVDMAESGIYFTTDGQPVSWKDAVENACHRTLSLPPDAALPAPTLPAFPETRLQVANETTLEAARRLTERGARVLALNFANGIQPGGGFLNGARAQEEVLCRSSALYLTLRGDPMYEAHRRRPLPDSSAWAILAPEVPVFRRDDGAPLDQPWRLSVLTCAAPYAPTVGQPRAGDLLQARIRRVLAIARAYDYPALVLGAWGCGAFANDPERTARDFRETLAETFAGAFAEVVFAIADWSPERRFLAPFRDVFATEDSDSLSSDAP
ncbi:TIGR02452 family protein [Thiocystis minor]|uniref:TIGR02452 family protein n=1 Tax=Thiocystis minor TaxID=61597 RepID=UPI001914046F|nr:TIGR02452 family protein [Thiocystis minor]MBK5963340.1 TIGR02452 family protein [Thiocystis minor]